MGGHVLSHFQHIHQIEQIWVIEDLVHLRLMKGEGIQMVGEDVAA